MDNSIQAATSTLATFRHVVTLKDGARVLFRPLVPGDYDGLVALYSNLTPDDLETMRQHVTPELIQSWIDTLDYNRVLPVVAEVRHEIIGEGTLHFGQGPYRHTAEVRLYLAKPWRQRGVGTHMLRTMIDLARRQGIGILTAEVIAAHTHVVKAFSALGFKIKATLDDYFMLPDGRTLDVVLMVNSLISHSDEF